MQLRVVQMLMVTGGLSLLVNTVLGRQIPQVSPQSNPQRASANYINPGAVASPARRFLFAFGDRIQRPGKERVTLIGTFTDSGGTTNVSLVWESPGRFRLDRSDKPGPPLLYDPATGWTNPGAISIQDASVVESLLDDRPESFFYDIAQGAGQRFLGSRFRADNGDTPNYEGPWYDVYESFARVRVPGTASKKRKTYFFDSETGLLSRVEYQDLGSIRVRTELSGWQIVNGQAFPGSIARKENGVTVMTVSFSSVSFGPSIPDDVFSNR